MLDFPPTDTPAFSDDDDSSDEGVSIVWTAAPPTDYADDADFESGGDDDDAWTEDSEEPVDWEAEEAAAIAEAEAAAPIHYLGRVAVVGYPNVGKSTLVNRLSGTRTAIVHDQPGVTRDRKDVPVEWNGEQFLLIDTGGVDQGDPRPMAKQIIEQVELAIAESDLVLFIVDAKAGMTAADQELAELLRRRRVPTLLLANKIDNVRDEPLALEFHALALGDPMPISGNHGNNTGDLLDEVVARLREFGTAFDEADNGVIHIAVLGRPNVGKSTLVNAMLGNDRVIVSEVAGTTRDAIDTNFKFEDRDLVLVDTAGIRRRSKGGNDIDYYSEVRTLQAADRADVALLLVDASQGVRETDLSIADKIMERDCATIVVLSKWDINDCDLGDVKEMIATKLRQRPEVVTASGLTGRNVQKILQKAVELHGRYAHRAGTGELNRLISDLKQMNPPPLDRRSKRRLNMLYATQYQTAPPRIRVFVNDRRLVTRSYAYFMENRIREHFHFEGCPLIIDYMTRS